MRLIKKIFIVLLVVFLFSLLTKNFFEYLKNRQFYQTYKENYEKEKKKNIELKTTILRKNSFYEIEKVIRNRLNLSRPGEATIIIPESVITPSPTPTTPPPVYQQWLNLFIR